MANLWFVFALAIEVIDWSHAQYYPLPASSPYDQNATLLPYPYQTTLGLNPAADIRTPNQQGQSNPIQYPYPLGYGIPNSSQMNLNAYYALLAQQGMPAYQYSGMGYPGYPGIPPQYLPQGFGYSQPGTVYTQTGVRYPSGLGQTGFSYTQQSAQAPEANTNIKTEIIDVSPDYQRQLLGWPADTSSSSRQGSPSSKPRYIVDVDTQTSNNTVIPTNLTKPIVTEKKFVTSIRRTFVYDSSKPETFKPINVHIINGQQVTTTAPPETTVNENVQGLTTSSVRPSGRRFMDVPKSCPKGTMQAHNGECIAPFAFRNTKNTTYVPEESTESEIEM